jgi:cell division protein FtsB
MKILPVALLLILLVLQFRLWVGDGSLAELRQLEAQVEVQQLENEELRKRNEMLESEVLDLKNGLEAVEERARSELGMVKEGETFYLIVE